MNTIAEEKQRTLQQNKALHKMFGTLSDDLNEKGLNMRVVLKPTVEIKWDASMIKEYLWRPIQKAMLHKDSTKDLSTAEVDKVFEMLQYHLGEKFGVELEFPSFDSIIDEHHE